MAEDDLSIQGTLAETTVPDLIRSMVHGGESGIVTLEGIQRHDSIYIDGGRITFATSSDPDLGLGEVLLRSGELNRRQYEEAMDRVAGTRSMASILLDLRYLQPDELMRAIERQVSSIVRRMFTFRTGGYTIEFTSDFPSEILSLQIPNERLILDAVAGIEHWSLIARGILKPGLMLCQAPGADSRIYHLDLREEETLVYSLLTEPLTVDGLCDRSYLSNFVTCRTAWALFTANLISERGGDQADERRSAVELELELEGEVERYNGAYQQIFALVSNEIGDHVYDFIDRVVTHLSPETAPYLSGISMVNEARVDYDQLLNNTIASGSADRKSIVMQVLNELLAGWIFEIRDEFKGRLDAQVGKIVGDVRRQ